ncbi:MAG: hypothetical protein HY816_06110 [Candidatus Wallbacteria bacterium]|nr:hypothetical protein [Candidatus Wallbacteria bacterium]
MKPTLTREEIVKIIEKRLRGEITQAELARWADDQFQKWDADEQIYDERHNDQIDETIYALQGCEQPGRQLSEADLRECIAQLTRP